jgi:hypothetical protein
MPKIQIPRYWVEEAMPKPKQILPKSSKNRNNRFLKPTNQPTIPPSKPFTLRMYATAHKSVNTPQAHKTATIPIAIGTMIDFFSYQGFFSRAFG